MNGNSDRNRQIITSLIGKAIKFTQSGQIIINVATQAQGNIALTVNTIEGDKERCLAVSI